ncbi:hypothetical protein HYX19_02805 [Candidatus Woesearchaeota archaeon]|nr:hypothetical protein [Candidatus Woesearchaeota archaeon]
MDRTKYEIEIKHHAFIRATQRKISPDLIENCIKSGKVKKFGKNHVKFISRSTICVGELVGLKIKIITIEGRKK